MILEVGLETARLRYLSKTKRVVVKVGSSLLTGAGAQGVRTRFLGSLASQILRLQARGLQCLVVTSGAIAAGLHELGWARRPKEIPKLQALAAVGQCNLMHAYESTFKRYGLKVAQVLLTWDDLSNQKRYSNARNTLSELFDAGIIPVVNENDTVAVEEIKFGENDNLAALVSHLVGADLLVLLTDINGLYVRDPKEDAKAPMLEEVVEWSPQLEKWAGGSKSLVGTGGMASKVQAAKRMRQSGLPMVIANGNRKEVLLRVMDGKREGTFFHPASSRMSSRERWLAWGVKPKGSILVDEGARKALLERKTSLLPSGIKAILGFWAQGDVVRIMDSKEMVIARGIANYSSQETDRIKGLRTVDIEKTLGYKVYDEVVHRDNMVQGEDL